MTKRAWEVHDPTKKILKDALKQSNELYSISFLAQHNPSDDCRKVTLLPCDCAERRPASRPPVSSRFSRALPGRGTPSVSQTATPGISEASVCRQLPAWHRRCSADCAGSPLRQRGT